MKELRLIISGVITWFVSKRGHLLEMHTEIFTEETTPCLKRVANNSLRGSRRKRAGVRRERGPD